MDLLIAGVVWIIIGILAHEQEIIKKNNFTHTKCDEFKTITKTKLVCCLDCCFLVYLGNEF